MPAHVSYGDELDHGRSCLLITGAPGAGKSTVSRLVADALTHAALIDGDVVNRLMVSGRVWALGEPADEAARQVRLCNRNLCELAANFADAGFTPVIDWIIPDRQQLDQYRQVLGPRCLLVVVLAPSIDVCRYRNTIRNPEDQFFFALRSRRAANRVNNPREMTPSPVLRPWLDMATLMIWSTSLLSATGFFSPGIRFRFRVTDLPPHVCATYALSHRARSDVLRSRSDHASRSVNRLAGRSHGLP